jgi:hypothetical protein
VNFKRFIQWTTSCLLSVAICSNNCLAQDVLFLENNSSVYISSGAQLQVSGGVNAQAGSSIMNYGEINVANNTVAGNSNWTDNTSGGIFGLTTGEVFLKGTHLVTGGRFYDLTISTTGSVQLGDDLLINNSLNLTKGIITTDAFKVDIVASPSNSLISGIGNSNFDVGYVRGNLRRSINPNTETYYFPVGKTGSTNSNPLSFINNNLTGVSNLLVTFSDKQGSDAGLVAQEFGIDYAAVNSFGTWNVIGNSTPISGSFDLQGSLNNFPSLVDNNFALLSRSENSTNAADWVVPAGSSLPSIDAIGRTAVGGIATRNSISILGQFGIGETLTPLPLELLYFKGEHKKDYNLLTWATATEDDVQYYGLQKAWNDGLNFDEIGRVEARNLNTNTLTKYQFIDSEKLSGISYYRLKMVDLDGTTTFSNVISIGQTDQNTSFHVFPNPAKNFIKLFFRSNKTTQWTLSIMGEHGQLLREHIVSGESLNESVELDTSSFSPGLYVIKLCDSDGNCAIAKFVKI